MNRSDKSSLFSTFTTGSWYAYELIDYEPRGPLTCGKIQQGMKVFNNNYKVDVSVFPSSQLIFWELILEEKKKHTRRRSKDQSQKEETISKASKYKFAVSDEEELLFSHRVIPGKLKNELHIALHCKELRLLELCNSDPINLLMFHKQSSKQAPGHLALQYENKLESAAGEIPQGAPLRGEDIRKDTTGNLIHQKLGCNHNQIPYLKKVTTNMSNVPLNSKVAALKGFRVPEVEVEAHAPSVFHMYKELGDLGVIDDIPPWLGRIRTSGKAFCRAKYL